MIARLAGALLLLAAAGPAAAQPVVTSPGPEAVSVTIYRDPDGGGTMVGTIISQAGAAISTTGSAILSTLNGRVLSQGPSVTVNNTVINVPAP